MRFWPLEAVLHDKYLLPKEEAELIASFLNPMLRLNPDKRAKASELIHHAWLDRKSVAFSGKYSSDFFNRKGGCVVVRACPSR